ncbi:DUF3500 domain-containing protein [Blastopirellula sp. JC732]|uniref:DUF3500 domain-containing protein n=1 Tax=Blastopirellula sediminis TaxID=2894196 RepID=A0A9X1ML91_9BACT|nr:DUF3500 domain-containing protein [Blastopirellula sediminis]MCC9608913.1 DUF3500 domain-containing protein [Blastopirellula sediminis]MCC9628310.1 DUF3500 domain-containing protein [Blastopirellula sediminis]
MPRLVCGDNFASSGFLPSQINTGLPPASHTDAVVDAAEAFLESLRGFQRREVLTDFSPANASRWSNFPADIVQRNGLDFRDMSPEQLESALEVARVSLGQQGFDRMMEIRLADDAFAHTGIAGHTDLFGRNNYSIAMLGVPSKEKPWMLQFGGDHLAVNHYYHGAQASATPYFVGVEPIRWTGRDRVTHDPLKPMHESIQGLMRSLTPEQLRIARIKRQFNDVAVGPGRDGLFPKSRHGIAYSRLSNASQVFVQQAILAWTGDSPQAEDYRRRYFAELDQTCIAFSGTGDLKEAGDYVRIDGPHLWIELSCQASQTVFPIHLHAVWRDKATDYGGVLQPEPWVNGLAGGPK